jgi:PPOX class probable F420-dependent enzyme
VQIDRSTPFGARAAHRLTTDLIAWLTTVGKDGTPHPRPVWFLWDGETILIYSEPRTAKLTHLARTPRAAFNLDGDGRGGDIVVLTGSARVDQSAPPADQLSDYIEKYRAGIAAIGMTPEGFAAAYSIPVRFTPEKLSGH